MTSPESKSARAVAIVVLNQFDPKQNYASLVLEKYLQQTSEKQRATDLVLGTTRNQPAIDMVISKLSDCPIERIPAKLLNIIRIGAYELLYCPQTVEYAIVNEAVESTKKIGGKKQVGFVNAVLRQITRHITNRNISLSEAESQKTLPQTVSTGCQFDCDILPSSKTNPAEFLSTAFSLPDWLVSGWLSEFGFAKTQQICFASNRRPSLYIRPNPLKVTLNVLAEKFGQEKIDCKICDDKSMIRIKGSKAVAALYGFSQGLFSVQDITAYQVAKALNPRSDWTILDLCAAPGSKTTHLAELTSDRAKIIATDIDSQRLRRVTENINRLGLTSIKAVEYGNLEKIIDEVGLFDAVLLDVPCSNTGVLAKRPEVRFRIKPKAIAELAKIQSKLLEDASAMIKPHGKIVYSTCSIEKDENKSLISRFLKKNSHLKLEYEQLTLPSAEDFDHDGGYVAVISQK